MFALGLWLILSQFFLGYPFTLVGQNNTLRDQGFAIVLLLGGLYLHQVGINRIVTGLCIGAGFGLVMTALFLPHEATRIIYSEVATSALAIVGAVMAAASEQRGR